MHLPDFRNRQLRLAKAEELEKNGVIFIDKERAYIEQDVEIGKGTIIYPDTYLYRGTRIGEQCQIQQGVSIFETTLGNHVAIHCSSKIEHSVIGNDTEVDSFSLVKDSYIGEHCHVGTHAHIRDQSVVGDNCEIGSTEIARSTIGAHTKAKHGRYIGDAQIGEQCNIGAGTVFCNYDGKTKNRTILGNHVFIGSGTMLVAPLVMRDWSATGANTTLPKGTYEEGMLYYVKEGKLIAKPNPLAPKELRKQNE